MAFIQYAMQILFSLLMVSFLFIMLPRASASAGQDQRGARHAPGITDPPAAEGGRGAGLHRVQGRDFRLPGRGGTRHPRHLLQREAGGGHRDHRRHGLGQIDAGEPHPALLRRGIGEHPGGRRGHPGNGAGEAARQAGFVPQKAVLFNDTIANNIRYGTGGRHRPGGGASRGDRAGAGVHPGHAGRVPIGHCPGRHERVRRAEAAARHCPRPGEEARDLHIRRHFSALDFKTDARLRAALRRRPRRPR